MELSIKSGKEDFGFIEELNDAWISSRKIADVFEKDHSKVIRSIEQILEKDDDFNRANFGLVEYKDKKGCHFITIL